MAEAYDVLVLGAGPAGYVAAIRAAQLGLKVAVIERRWLGGVCLNVGCIPSKALLKNAEIATWLRQRAQESGMQGENLDADYVAAVRRSRQVAERLAKGVGFLLRKNGVTVYLGEAALVAPQTVHVRAAAGERLELRASHIIVATGASAVVPPGWSTDGERVLTYLEAILQERLPRSVVILGGGAIGVEFATLWNAYGSEVTLVEMLPRLVPLEDEEVSAELERAFRKRGIRLLTGHRVEAIESTATGARVTLTADGRTLTLEAEQALLALGFRPNSRGLGLEELGVALDERGFIQVDERMATTVPGIWAIGDVTGKLMLAHVGSAQGILCAESIAGRNPPPLSYEHMPRATYSQPQIASFGLTEAQARQRGYAVRVARFPFQANGKALALGDYGGWVKLVVDEHRERLLGAHLIGPEVTELLPELTLAARADLTLEHLARNVHAHPTLSEALMEAAHLALGQAIHV
jgi:dihydrolipoamide dehydrogenase